MEEKNEIDEIAKKESIMLDPGEIFSKNLGCPETQNLLELKNTKKIMDEQKKINILNIKHY